MGTVIVGNALLVVVSLIVRKMIKDKNKVNPFNVVVIANIVVDIVIN